MAYRAEIEIGVKGQQRIQRLSSEINKSAKAVDSLADSLGSRGVVSQSLNNFNKLLSRTKRTLDSVIAGTDAEKKAVKEYVTALGLANSFQERQNRLIAEEIRQRNGATAALKRYDVAAASRAKPGRSRPRQVPLAGQTAFSGPIGPGPASPTALSSRLPASSRFFGGTQFSGPIGPGPASSIFGGQSSPVEGRLKRILAIKKDELQLERALIGLQQKSKGLDAESVKENNRLLNLKADEFARNKEIIRQERVKQSILRKRQRLEAAGRTPGGGRRGRRGGQRFTDIATGAGFPLLFGGGPLQALAGGVGGAFGGLGGAIAGSAIVAQVEGFARAAAETGVALTSTGGALEFMREKSLFSSDAARERAAVLEELGQVEELAAHLGQEMANAIGNNGVKALQDLGETTKETTRLWNLLTTQLFRLVAGPLDAFLKAINQVLGGITVGQQFAARREDLGATGAAALDARVAELQRGDVSKLSERQINRGVRGVGAMSLVEARKQALSEEQFQVAAAPIPITAQDRRDITPGKTKAGRRSRVPDLDAEIQLQERLLTLNNQIAQAKRDENPVREAALQMEVALEKEAAKIAQIEAKRIPEVEKVLEKQLLQVQTSQELANIQNRLNDTKAQEAERAQDVLDGLLQEQALLQATLDGRKEEEQINQRVAEIMEKNSTLSEAEVRAILEGTQALKEKITLQQQQEQLYARIGQTINSGIVSGIQSAIDGSKSLGESLSGILKQLGGMFLQSAIGGFGTGGKPGTGLFGLLGFANGGYVTGPTPAVVGEGGEPEYLIPESKMRESMARYSRGARGSAVIPENGGDGTSGEGGGTAVAAPIDVRYNVERINSVDYVTAEQFQVGLARAAQQGAAEGERRAMGSLRNSAAVRRRIGV